MKIRLFKLSILAVMMLALVACSAPSKPSLAITSMSSTTPVENQEVTLQVSASDNKGVTRIELTEGGNVLAEASITPPQKTVMAPLVWRAELGQHTLSVRALNMDNQLSDPITVAMNVSAASKPTATPIPGPMPGPLPVPTAPPQPTGAPNPQPTQPPQPGPCSNNSQFVADVTVPDGTQWMPNQSFNKIWRIRNTGTCTWSTKYQLAFVSGEPMTGERARGLLTPVAPGQTVDILVTMGAPATAGPHSGQWQLKDEVGTLFGTMLKVAIVTVLPQPTACVPTIQYFNSDKGGIIRGQSTTLMWGLVGSANRAEIDNGIGGITTPGYIVVSPQQTTTYTLSAWCGATLRQAKVTISVSQPIQPTPVPPTAVPQPTAAPQRRNISGSWNAGEWMLELSEAMGCSSSNCPIRGTLTHGVLPAPQQFEVSGTADLLGGTVHFAAAIPGGPSFNGTLSADSRTLAGTLSSVGGITFRR